MEIQWDVLMIWNTLCISLTTFYVTFKLRRDMGKLKRDVQEIKLIMVLNFETDIIITKDLDFETGDANDSISAK